MVRVQCRRGDTRVWVDDGFLCGVGGRVGVMGWGRVWEVVKGIVLAQEVYGRDLGVLALDDGMG